jgi:hypothetical protein
MLKKSIAYSNLRVFLTFCTHSWMPLEPNLMEVTWSAKEFRAVAYVRTQFFNGLWVITNFCNDTPIKASYNNILFRTDI